jgi:peroxiredoxin
MGESASRCVSMARYLAYLLLLPCLVWAGAPAWVLPDLEGKAQPTSQYIGKGRWTVVAVWSVDCAICRRELHHMAFLHDERGAKGPAVLGLSVDGAGNRERVAAFVDEQGLSFPNLIGERGDILRFGAAPLKGTPTYLFFSPRGKLAAQHLGAMTQQEAERVITQLSNHPTAPRRGGI